MSNPIRLTFASSPNERLDALLDGSIRPHGAELAVTVAPPAEIFPRQLKSKEFDIAEMSLSTYLALRARGSEDMIAIPVFPSRRLFHTWLAVRSDSDVSAPEALRGKRIATGDFKQSASVWIRAILRHDFDLSPEWHVEPAGGAGGAAAVPAGVKTIPAGRKPLEMLLAGEVDAAAVLGPFPPPPDAMRQLRPLFRDPLAEGERLVKKHSFVPANHTYIIKGDTHRQHPWLSRALYDAFTQAKARAREKLAASIPSALFFGPQYLAMTKKALGDDPFPYGVEENRAMLELFVKTAVEDGIIERAIPIETLFADVATPASP